MMICAALQLQGEGCYTLQRVCAFFSIKASRLLQRACVRSRYGNIAKQVAERVLHDATLQKIVAILAESRTRFYFVQRLVRLVSQRFWPLHSMLHGAMVRATCLATALRDMLHEKLHRVTKPLRFRVRCVSALRITFCTDWIENIIGAWIYDYETKYLAVWFPLCFRLLNWRDVILSRLNCWMILILSLKPWSNKVIPSF